MIDPKSNFLSQNRNLKIMESNISVTPAPGASSNLSSSSIYNAGDVSWILTSSALVFLMGPGVGLFYSGLTKSKNALSLIMLSMAACAVVSIQVLLVFLSF